GCARARAAQSRAAAYERRPGVTRLMTLTRDRRDRYHVSVLTPCFNEEGNVEVLYERIRAVFERLPEYSYEHVFIDNASTDGTAAILRRLAARDRNVKVIVNTRNFGHIRSPYHALLQCHGDAVIGMASDLQDPPEMIPLFLEKWREGFKVVPGVQEASGGSPLMFAGRRLGSAVIVWRP